MNKAHTNKNWQNYPSTDTPLNAANLNELDTSVDTLDDRIIVLDTEKAKQSDLLQCLKNVTYDARTGIFNFTWQNGTTLDVDLAVEKIPVSFSMSAAGVITMTNADGTTYTADVGALIKTYSFNQSTTIKPTVTTDASGNKTITMDLIDGSIAEGKLQTNFLADCRTAKAGAEAAQTASSNYSIDSEAWANGTRGGAAVPSTDPAYHNNAKYWAGKAAVTSLTSMADVEIDAPSNGQSLKYNGSTSKWENKYCGENFYATCATARSSANKEVVCDEFRLIPGAVIYVRFTTTGGSNPSSGNLTLNVNNTGAKNIVFKDTYNSATYANSGLFMNNVVLMFVYDGTNWVCFNDVNTTYTNASLGQGYATCGTAEATIAKVASLSSYSLQNGGIVVVRFTYSVPANSTLNVNSRGAKAIKYRNAALVDEVIKAGDLVTFMYDGTSYHIISIDRGSSADWNWKGVITKAEYDALTDEQKLNGIYGIKG